MAYRITESQVRDRLKNLTDSDVSDATLGSIAYIPASEAEVDEILSDNGLTYSSLSSNKQTLVKAAEIALTAYKIVIDAPEETFKTGPLDAKPASSRDKEVIGTILMEEFWRLMGRVGCIPFQPHTGVNYGDDYIPDGEDDTNILLGDEDEDTVSLWP